MTRAVDIAAKALPERRESGGISFLARSAGVGWVSAAARNPTSGNDALGYARKAALTQPTPVVDVRAPPTPNSCPRGGGELAPLLLLHGIGSAADSFLPLVAELDGGRPIVAWDAPGYGVSLPLDEAWPSASDYARRLLGLTDRLGWRAFHLVGHSLGALIAARVAVHALDRIESLTLISPALGYASAPEAELPAAVASRVADLDRLGSERFAATRAPRLVHRPEAKRDVVAAVAATMARVKMPGYLQASRMLASGDLLAEAARIAVPVHIIVGAEDQVTPPANARRLYDALRAARPDLTHRIDVVADAGHAVCQEKPTAIARLLGSQVQSRVGQA